MNAEVGTEEIFKPTCKILNELYFWTLSIVWCLQKKLRNKIYIPKNHNTPVQNSHKGQLLNTEPLTWVHTQHKPLKQVRQRWQQMTQPLHTAQLLKPGKHKYRIKTKAHAHSITP
jgi:phage FluMu protein Com